MCTYIHAVDTIDTSQCLSIESIRRATKTVTKCSLSNFSEKLRNERRKTEKIYYKFLPKELESRVRPIFNHC